MTQKYPDTVCMAYFTYIGVVSGVNVGIYTIHGVSGYYPGSHATGLRPPQTQSETERGGDRGARMPEARSVKTRAKCCFVHVFSLYNVIQINYVIASIVS